MDYPEQLESLPVFPFLDEIAAALKNSPAHALVLTAETAAGKSTAVPFALMKHFTGKTVMLEPRRLAVQAIAFRTADLLHEMPGGTCGYRMHLETRVSPQTRFEILTEAVLVRMMQSDPSLDGISVVVIDEFHERSVHADLSLSLLKECMMLRDDLYVLVMSATIDTEKICSFLSCPSFFVPGRTFPVTIEYAPPGTAAGTPAGGNLLHSPALLAETAAAAVKNALLSQKNGSILVFLPGIADIRRTFSLLEDDVSGAELLILHSSVPVQEQRKVLHAAPPGTRRVILSSAIAETSLTVPDVTTVVDCGLARVSRYKVSVGMNRLQTEIESVFSAVQRAGRAGRTAPGRCIRLWAEHEPRVENFPPEILRTDLVPVVLECVQWGARSAGAIEWLDAPPSAGWNSAMQFLTVAGCLEKPVFRKPVQGKPAQAVSGKNPPYAEECGAVTPLGRHILRLGVHPRIALVVLCAAPEALDYAVKYSGASPAEQEKLKAYLRKKKASGKTGQIPCAENLPQEMCRYTGSQVLLAGFFDRLAHYCGGGIYQFPSGRKASLKSAAAGKPARQVAPPELPEWIIAPEADAGEREGCIYSWEPVVLPQGWLEKRLVEKEELFFAENKSNKSGQALKKIRTQQYGKIVVSTVQLEPTPDDRKAAFCTYVRANGLGVLPWNGASESFLLRARFYCRQNGLPDENLLDSIEDWLLPFLPPGENLTPQLLLDALRCRFDGRVIDREVPLRITLENGRQVPVLYEETDKSSGPRPVIEIIIQQIFGCRSTPYICGMPVLLRLLSPARRPLQVTTDLAGFWEHTWPEVCKEMKGRYPKHNWDPGCFDR